MTQTTNDRKVNFVFYLVALRGVKDILTNEEAGIKRQVQVIFIYSCKNYHIRKDEFKKGLALFENIIEAIPSAMILETILKQAGICL